MDSVPTGNIESDAMRLRTTRWEWKARSTSCNLPLATNVPTMSSG